MDWKKIIISSTHDARQLLCHIMPPMFPEKVQITCNCDKGLDLKIRPHDRGSIHGADYLVKFKLRAGREIEIHNIYVDDTYKMHCIGFILAKCACGIAYEKGATSLSLLNVTKQGSGFSSTLGATPKSSVCNLAKHIETTMKLHKDQLCNNSTNKISTIHKIAITNPLAAWRVLSQNKIRLQNGRLFNQQVFANYAHQDFTIDLSSPVALSFLENRCGSIPQRGYKNITALTAA